MRIWLAAAQDSRTFGGVYRSMTSLAGGLSGAGHKVKIVWLEKDSSWNRLFFPFTLLLKLFFSLFFRPHALIARSGDGILCALAARVRIIGTKVILHSHGWEEKAYGTEKRLPRAVIAHPTTWKARLIRFPLLRASLCYSHACICGTIEEARWLKQRYPACRDKIHLVPNGIVPGQTAFWPVQDELPPSFLVVGGFTWKKNVEYSLALFAGIQKSIPDARLFCVGTGSVPACAERLIAWASDSIFIVEREYPERMARWYETCPFLIFPSRYEGGRAFTILEAQNRGMVVFASALPSSRELIRDRQNGVLFSGCDIAADAERVVSVCKDQDLCREIGMAAWKSSARSRIDRQALRLLRILQKQ